MKCKWCAGTAKECGCGYGYCAHCINGETTDPPFGPMESSSKELEILTDYDFDKMDIGRKSAIDSILEVSLYLKGRQVLSEQEIKVIKDYWEDSARDENLGEVMQRVAWLVNQK